MKKVLLTMLLLAAGLLPKAQNVGIGTTTPADKLHIVIGNSASGGLLIGEASKRIVFLGDSTTTNENGVLRLFNNSETENVRIGANTDSWLLGGNLGIGTNTPLAKLHISGSFRLENGSEAVNRLMMSSNNGTATWTDPSAAGLVLGSGAAGRLAYWQSSDSITSSSKLFWDNTNSSLGIGNSTPSEKLDIVLGASESGGLRVGESSKRIAFLGDSTTSSENGVLRLFDNAQTETVRLGANTDSWLMGGDLGIGTIVPTSRLHVYSAGDNTIPLQVNKSGGLQLFRILQGGVGNGALSVHNSTGDTSVYVNSNGNSWLLGGNLGIGTSNPTNELTINSASPAIQLQNSGVSKGFLSVIGDDMLIATNNGNTGNLKLKTDGTDRLTINSIGNVGIGTNSPTYRLTIKGTDPQIQLQDNNGTNLGFFALSSTFNDVKIGTNSGNDGDFIIKTNGSDAVYVNRFGDVGLNAHPYFGGRLLQIFGSGHQYALYVEGLPVRDNGLTTWSVLSDRRLKKDIHSYDDGLQQLLQINPVRYKYNTDLVKKDTAEVIGTIAQDLQKIAPYMVTTDKKTGYLGIEYHALFFMMINAFKEVNNMLEASKERISVLEAALKNREPQTISVQDKKLEEMQKQIDELKKLLETRK